MPLAQKALLGHYPWGRSRLLTGTRSCSWCPGATGSLIRQRGVAAGWPESASPHPSSRGLSLHPPGSGIQPRPLPMSCSRNTYHVTPLPAPTQLLPSGPAWPPQGMWGRRQAPRPAVPAFPGSLAPAPRPALGAPGEPRPYASPRLSRPQADLVPPSHPQAQGQCPWLASSPPQRTASLLRPCLLLEALPDCLSAPH